MSEKLMVTQGQRDIIEKALKNRNGDRAQLIGDHSVMRGSWIAEYRVLDDLTVSDMARIVYDGDYEVEPEEPQFKTGDKIILWGRVATLEKLSSNDIAPAWKIDGVDGLNVYESELIRATEEEIYWLHELGRDEVGEFREGDVLLHENGLASRIYSEPGIYLHRTTIESARNAYENADVKGIYPAESFKPFKKESGNQ